MEAGQFARSFLLRESNKVRRRARSPVPGGGGHPRVSGLSVRIKGEPETVRRESVHAARKDPKGHNTYMAQTCVRFKAFQNVAAD